MTRLAWTYAVLAALGAVLPLSQFLPWLLEHGVNVPRFLGDLFANPVSAFFGFDVIVSAVVMLVFIATEGRRLKVRHLWLPVVGGVLIGVSFGLPVFLLQRELTRSCCQWRADNVAGRLHLRSFI